MSIKLMLYNGLGGDWYLTDGTDYVYCNEYTPKTPDITITEATAILLEDGGDITASSLRNVTEDIQVTVVGSTTDGVKWVIESLETEFLMAEKYNKDRTGYRLWLQFDCDTGAWYRSEILSGQVILPDEDLLRGQWLSKKVELTLRITRRFFWEMESPREIALMVPGVTTAYVTGGATVGMNYPSPTRRPVVLLQSSGANGVVGILPTPAIITIENSFNTTDGTTDIYVGLNAWNYPASWSHWFEGETADTIAGTESTAADTHSSNAVYQPATWGGTENSIFVWNITSTQASYFRGGWYRVQGSVWASTTGVKVKASLRWDTDTQLTELAATPWITLNTAAAGNFHDFGVMQFPPWLAGQNNLDGFAMCLRATAPVTNATVNVDVITLMPLDGYRAYKMRAYAMDYQDEFEDDPSEGIVYGHVNEATKNGLWVAQGRPIMLQPNRTQMLKVLAVDVDGSLDAQRTSIVQVLCRPRFLTL